jgi:hypothetical protein
MTGRRLRIIAAVDANHISTILSDPIWSDNKTSAYLMINAAAELMTMMIDVGRFQAAQIAT